MMTVCIDKLRAHGFSYIAIIDLDNASPFKFTRTADARIDMSGYADSWAHPDKYGFSRELDNFDYFFAIGADILDGHYSDRGAYRHLLLADIAERLGLRTTLIGFSYNEKPGENALQGIKRLRKSVRICSRDPVSNRRLTRHLGRAPTQTADLAFLLKAEKPSDQEIQHWLDENKLEGHPVFGINAIKTSKFFADNSLESENLYFSFYSAMLTRIAESEPKARFLFIPHDYRPNGIGERPFLENLISSLPVDLQQRSKLLDTDYNVAEIKWLVGEIDFLVSSRMHLAIGSIDQETPVFCFEYQGKFQGLFELLEIPELLSSMEAAILNPKEVIDSVLHNIDQRASLRERIKNKLPELHRLAEMNFDIR